MAACAVGNGHAIHAMVLDCVKEIGNELFFLFKNTYKNDKQVKIQVGMEFNIFILILNTLFIYVKKEMFKLKKKMLETHRWNCITFTLILMENRKY